MPWREVTVPCCQVVQDCCGARNATVQTASLQCFSVIPCMMTAARVRKLHIGLKY